MLNEKIFQFKSELRRIRKGDVLRMVLNQKERKCVLGGVCPFLFEYRRNLFCVSEILGQGCQMERFAGVGHFVVNDVYNYICDCSFD